MKKSDLSFQHYYSYINTFVIFYCSNTGLSSITCGWSHSDTLHSVKSIWA